MKKNLLEVFRETLRSLRNTPKSFKEIPKCLERIFKNSRKKTMRRLQKVSAPCKTASVPFFFLAGITLK